jgi:hypothetical protein
VLDAEFLVRSGCVTWRADLEYAAHRALVLTFETALGRVRGVPPEVMRELGQWPASHVEALELRHLTDPRDRVGAEAARTLATLFREKAPIVTTEDLRPLERRPGFPWDPRWVKEWS